MSDYAAIVRRDTFAHRLAAHGLKPYWSTNSGDGRYCFVSFSGDDRVGVISYATEREVASIPVGDHPQRMRMGALAEGALGVRPGTGSSPARPGGPRPRLRVTVRPRRLRANRPVRVRVRVTALRSGRRVAVRGARVLVGGLRARTNRRGRAVLRKRRGFERVRRYRVRASRKGYRTGFARVRAVRG
jgi:YVTN family beta-propeller protein